PRENRRACSDLQNLANTKHGTYGSLLQHAGVELATVVAEVVIRQSFLPRGWPGRQRIALTWHNRMTTGKLAAAPSGCTRLHNAGLSAMEQPYGARPARSSRSTRRSTRGR